MATELKGTSTGVQIAASAAGLIANIVAPGSGPMVAGVVSKGAQIFEGIAGIFKKKKDEGMSDEAASAAAAASMSEAEKQQIQKVMALDAQYSAYMASITAEDRELSTILARAKVSGQSPLQAYSKAVANGTINPALLGVFSYMANPTSAQASAMGTGPQQQSEASNAPVGAVKPIPGAMSTYDKGEGVGMVGALMALGSLGLAVKAAHLWFVEAPREERNAISAKKRARAAKNAREERMKKIQDAKDAAELERERRRAQLNAARAKKKAA